MWHVLRTTRQKREYIYSDSEDAGTGTARSSFANCSVSVCFQDPPMQPPLHRAAAGNNFPSETFTAELLEDQVEAL